MVKIFFTTSGVGFSRFRKFVIPFCHVFVNRMVVENLPQNSPRTCRATGGFYFMISFL